MLNEDDESVRAYLISLTSEARLQDHEAYVANFMRSPRANRLREANPHIADAFKRYCGRVELARIIDAQRPSEFAETDLYAELNNCDAARNRMIALVAVAFAQSDPARITGAKQRKVLKALREAKNSRAKCAVEERRKLVQELMSQTRLTKGALDKWIVDRLTRDHGIIVSERTVRGDRAAIEGGAKRNLAEHVKLCQ